MASKNEKRAAELGISLAQYKKTDEHKASSGDKKSQKKQEKRVKSYYKEEKQLVESKAKTETQRLQEDLTNILAELGIAKTRAIEDYTRNIKNIEENKGYDVAELQDYVNTTRERAGEDLETALSKEARRYTLELDKTNQELANAGLTFSERKAEQNVIAEGKQQVKDIETESARSFQDVARYEALKTRELELKYGQQQDAVTTQKERTLEDIVAETQKQTIAKQRGIEDIQTSKQSDLRNIGYQESGAISDIGNFFEQRAADRTAANRALNLSGI